LYSTHASWSATFCSTISPTTSTIKASSLNYCCT
jgi:hypothetical protein